MHYCLRTAYIHKNTALLTWTNEKIGKGVCLWVISVPLQEIVFEEILQGWINLSICSYSHKHSVYTHFFRTTIWDGYQYINKFDLKFGMKSLCNHPAFKAEDDRTTIMTSINRKKKQVMPAAIQKTEKIYKDRAKNTLATLIFLLCVARDS